MPNHQPDHLSGIQTGSLINNTMNIQQPPQHKLPILLPTFNQFLTDTNYKFD
jgi:hypothetical protein